MVSSPQSESATREELGDKAKKKEARKNLREVGSDDTNDEWRNAEERIAIDGIF